jgi:AcrR family transcriptional regulator
MSPRPRQASDEEILKAAFRAVARLGPARLTLADVAAEAGISAPAVVQRFGSKRALLLAAAADAAGGADFIFPALRARHRSPLAALLGVAECMSVMGADAHQVANTLAFLRGDVADPEFRRHARAAARGMRSGIEALLAEAVAAGELAGCRPRPLAAALQAALDGSLLAWAVEGDGDLAAWVRRDLRTLLAPYRVRRRRRAARAGAALRARAGISRRRP